MGRRGQLPLNASNKWQRAAAGLQGQRRCLLRPASSFEPCPVLMSKDSVFRCFGSSNAAGSEKLRTEQDSAGVLLRRVLTMRKSPC
ncbi:leucine-rich repeat-containing protein 3B isoform X3 [Grus americana]|uniref:leucine-rich repeat-containing protein 3B isoform X3 n=1 Tax=Grus americana TaxID=9117 RepID=UPI002408001C|nr:leucine-rich repeat-containing protein 3B isoform X3 [Grus americana]